MRLLRYGPEGQERPGLLDEGGRIRDLSDKLNDIDCGTLAPERLAALAKVDPETLPVAQGTLRFAPPVSGIGKIIAVGLNYADHAREASLDVPEEPILFTKAITSLTGPNNTVILPRDSEKSDWEVELAVIIGKRAQYVDQNQAAGHIAGYSIMNDVSERGFQIDGTGQWVKGKSADTFAPLGPWLVTTDEISDPQNLKIWLEVNGQRFQDANTSTMIFGITFLVGYISRFMTLMPGDVIATGTPPGVGMGQKPQVFLKPGDVMRLGIEGLGEQRQEVAAWSAGG
jgi:2-keto-4-pentenoate hydratase/2-oxohepta-3-ene-1,7-dioic acid hydratase in catechol pathway